MTRGIIETTVIDVSLFKQGAPFQVHYKTNDFRVVLVDNCTETELTLKGYYPEEIELKLSVFDLRYNTRYELTPLKRDYDNKIGEK